MGIQKSETELVVLSGLPGFGKSTYARNFVEAFTTTNEGATTKICSADDFHINKETGEYEFDPTKTAQAHSWCKSEVLKAVADGVDLVIVDNTNLSHWEREVYIDIGRLFCQSVAVHFLVEEKLFVARGLARRNVHGVPDDVLGKMLMNYDWETVPEFCSYKVLSAGRGGSFAHLSSTTYRRV